MSFHLSSVKTSCLSYDKHSTRQGKPIKKIRLNWLLNASVMNRRLFLCQLAFWLACCDCYCSTERDFPFSSAISRNLLESHDRQKGDENDVPSEQRTIFLT